MTKNLVLGAGITGLSFAYHIKDDFLILEKEAVPGGLCASVAIDGYNFDYSGHFFHAKSIYAKKLLKKLLGNNIAQITRNASIYFDNTLVPYPFQANLAALSKDKRLECLIGVLERNKYSNKSGSFLDWSLSSLGPGITKYFMQPYNEKLWTVAADVLTTDWLAPFVPKPSVTEIFEGALSCQKNKFGYNQTFYYPKKGGIQSLINALNRNSEKILYNEQPHEIDLINKSLITMSGKKFHFENLISTIPLVPLLNTVKDLPKSVREAGEKLRWNSVTCFNIGVKQAKKKDIANGTYWMYFPEKDFIFYRTGVYSNIVSSLAPAGRFSLYTEVSCKPQTKLDMPKVIKKVISGLREASVISPDDEPEVINILTMPFAYVIYDSNWQKARKLILSYLESKNLYSIGRYGAWKYSFMEESILDSKALSEKL